MISVDYICTVCITFRSCSEDSQNILDITCTLGGTGVVFTVKVAAADLAPDWETASTATLYLVSGSTPSNSKNESEVSKVPMKLSVSASYKLTLYRDADLTANHWTLNVSNSTESTKISGWRIKGCCVWVVVVVVVVVLVVVVVGAATVVSSSHSPVSQDVVQLWL